MFKKALSLICLMCLLAVSPATAAQPVLPNKILWAWRRAEDLSYIDPHEFGVAYLACQAFLTGDSLRTHWRDQPLHVPPDTVMCPVLRIDIDSQNEPSLSDRQLDGLAAIVNHIAGLPRTAQVQIDFDARQSQRAFYKRLLDRIATDMPSTRVSITALASWCLFDNWIKDLPVIETIPMMFSLGPERKKILLYFHAHSDFLVGGCCKSLGLSLEDNEVNQLMIPNAKQRKISVRFYVFTRTPWTRKKLHAVQSMLSES